MNERVVVIISVLAFINLTAINVLSWMKVKLHPAYFWLGCMFFATSMAITNNLHIFINHGNIWFYHFALFVNLAWGAYLIQFINSLRNSSEKRIQVNWKLFIPAFLYLPFVILCVLEPHWGVDSITLAKSGQMTIFGMLYNLIICFYTIGANLYLLVREYRGVKSDELVKSKQILERKEILWIMLFLQSMAFLPFIFKFDLEYIISYMPFFGQVFFLYIFFRLSNPTLSIANKYIGFKTDLSAVKLGKYASVKIQDEKVDDICLKMKQLMDVEEPFLNMDYSLSEMSKQLGITTNTLSMILNNKMSTSFPDYINSYRIGRALKLLSELKERKLTIEAVAYDSGFNNRTSFYAAFKKHTGTLPSEFVKAQKRETYSIDKSPLQTNVFYENKANR